jgi:HlyD family secretion protein
VDNPDKLLRVGMSATAKLVVDQRKDVPLVDEMALIFKNDSTFVKIVTDTTTAQTRIVPVTVGISDGIRAEISTGLQGGELVSLGNAVAQGEKRRR